jgi:hypothetical protein
VPLQNRYDCLFLSSPLLSPIGLGVRKHRSAGVPKSCHTQHDASRFEGAASRIARAASELCPPPARIPLSGTNLCIPDDKSRLPPPPPSVQLALLPGPWSSARSSLPRPRLRCPPPHSTFVLTFFPSHISAFSIYVSKS